MEECLICKAPLEYLNQDEVMECAVCHKKEPSKTRCVNGHYVCSDCHTQGMDSIFGLCLAETSKDPVAIVRRMMDLPFCHMHGPEHQRGAVPGHRHGVHAPGPGALGAEQPDDRTGLGAHWPGGWPPVLQAGFLPGDIVRR